MITEFDKAYIKEHYKDLSEAAQTGILKTELQDRMKQRFPFECWSCPRKIKVNINNYLNEYVQSITRK